MHRIGVRALRQHASRYLAMVARGERIEVTERGWPVALLVPAPADAWNNLVTSGRARAPQDDADIADEPPAGYAVDATRTLQAMRDQER